MVDPGDPLPATAALVRVTRLAAAIDVPGAPSPAGGAASLAYLEAAFAPVIAGAAQALCTAPLSKAQVALSLPGFVGHTEWLEARGGGSRSVMMLAGRRLRVALVTNHLSLRDGDPAAHAVAHRRPWPGWPRTGCDATSASPAPHRGGRREPARR